MAEQVPSIEEMNKLRAAAGMAPLPTPNGSGKLNFKPPGSSDEDEDEDAEDQGSTLETRQAAAGENWKKLQDEQDEKNRREAKRQALKKQRDAAQRDAKLTGKGLGEAEGDEVDTRSWLLDSKKRQKKIDKQRRKKLDREQAEQDAQAQYTDKDLAGKKVGHELDAFDEEGEAILTLKDAAVDASDDDELENVGIREKEKLAERTALKRKKPLYDPNEVDETGERTVLRKYDEEIEGKKSKRFTLDGEGRTAEERAATQDAKSKPSGPQGMTFSLDFLEDDKPVSDYVDPSEMKMRKPKKKEKSKKQRPIDGEEIFAADHPAAVPTQASDDMDLDKPDSNGIAAADKKRSYADASFVDDEDLQSSLAAQRREALKKRKKTTAGDLARQLREEASVEAGAMDESEDGGLVLDETSQFVANLQDRPQVSRDRQPQTQDPPETIVKAEPMSPDSPRPNDDERMPESYNGVDEEMTEADLEARVKREQETPGLNGLSATGIDEESSIEHGIGATLSMLRGRGLVEAGDGDELAKQFAKNERFRAKVRAIEAEADAHAKTQRERDRASGKLERMSVREREAHAQWENKQRDQLVARRKADMFNRDYRPTVDIKHVDSYGRAMNEREAFKDLSHQFHGKGSGKLKTEKHLKKISEEKERLAKSSLDSSQRSGMDNAAGATARKNRQAGVRLQ